MASSLPAPPDTRTAASPPGSSSSDRSWGGGGGDAEAARLTPESEAEEGEDETAAGSSARLGPGEIVRVVGAGETFELQDRRGHGGRLGTDGVHDDASDDGYGDGDGYAVPGEDDSDDDGEYHDDDDDDAAGVGGDSAGLDDDSSRRRRRRRASMSTVASFQLYTPDEERAVVRKFDRRLVLFVAFLYMLSFLDRSNIGNARIAGMDADLQTTPPRADWYEWSLTVFYITYILFEPMALLWRVVPAHVYVSVIVLSWGLTASLQSVAPSYPFLLVFRAALGIGEAAFAGIPFYLSFFFRREEMALRTAVFISAAPLATTFASSLAYLIVRLGRAGPIAPWRLLFLLEGFPSVLAAAAAWHLVPDSPQTASYLSRRERRVARLRLRHQAAGPAPPPASSSPDSPQSSRRHPLLASLSVLVDPFAWTTAFMLFLANLAYSSLPVFLPTILTTSLRLSPLSAEALAAPPYLVAFVVVIATAIWSDRVQARSPFIVFHALTSAAGYAFLALAPRFHAPAWTRYLAVFPAASGFFAVVVLVIVWALNNQPGEPNPDRGGGGGRRRRHHRHRAGAGGAAAAAAGRGRREAGGGHRQGMGFALLQLVGQCGPLLGTRLYPDSEAPGYERGMAVCCAAMLGVAVLAGVGAAVVVWRNRAADRGLVSGGGGVGVAAKDAEREGEGEEEGQAEEEVGLVAGRVQRRGGGFRYII